MTKTGRIGDRIGGAVLWAVAVTIWWQSGLWPTSGDVGGNPVVLPRILAGIMAAMGAWLIFGPLPTPEAEGEDRAGFQPMHAFMAIGITLVLALVFEWLGLIASGIAYILLLQRIVGAPWRVAVPFALLTPITIWLVFVKALSVPLPQGEIWIRLGF